MKIINNEKHYNMTEAGELLGISRSRIQKRIQQDKRPQRHKTVFPNVIIEKVYHEAVWIPESDINNFKKLNKKTEK